MLMGKEQAGNRVFIFVNCNRVRSGSPHEASERDS